MPFQSGCQVYRMALCCSHKQKRYRLSLGTAEDVNSGARSCNTPPPASQLGGETTAPHPHPLLVAPGVALKSGYVSNPFILENIMTEVNAVMSVCIQRLGSADSSPTPCWFLSFRQPRPVATSSGGAHDQQVLCQVTPWGSPAGPLGTKVGCRPEIL